MHIQRITTYSLLAHINNSTVGINDLTEIFVPLVKRIISKMENDGISKGNSLEEFKARIDDVYKLDMPYPLLKKIVKKIAAEENKSGSVNFVLHDDGSFIIRNFTFSDYEDIMLENEQEIVLLNDSYEKYLEINGLQVAQQPSIFEFLDSNRLALSEFFASKKLVQSEIEYWVQAQFVNSVKDIPKIFNVLRKVYLGSIITSYLEVDYGEIKTLVEFVFDTNFLISLLDLSSKEATHTCRKIIEICKRLNYKIWVLDITIEETRALILRTAETYETTFLPKKVDPESIYNACDRRGLKATDLEKIANHLEDELLEFGIRVVFNTDKFKNKARFSQDYERYLEIRTSKLSALHDATAIVYVRDKRGKRIKRFEDANTWFVTNTSHSIYHFKEGDFLPEIIRAEDLVNILWLSNPNVKAGETIEIGLTRMVSCAIENSLPSARVIKELDENIQKYGKEKIHPEDIVRVANKIANKSLVNLEELNAQAKESPEEFIKTLERVAAQQKLEEERKQQEVKAYLIKLRETSERKLNKIKKGYIKSHEERLNDLTVRYASKVKTFEMGASKSNDELFKSYQSLKLISGALETKSRRFAIRILALLVFGPSAILLIVWYKIGWIEFEPWTFLLSFLPLAIGFIYLVIKKREFSIGNLWSDLKDFRYEYLAKTMNFDRKHFIELKNRFEP